MREHTASVVLAYFFAFSNVVLTVLLWATLRVAPSDVLSAVTLFRDETARNHERFRDRLGDMAAELERRGVWMDSIDNEMAERARDRIFRSEFQSWLNEAQQINPNVQLPDLSRKATGGEFAE